MTVHCKLCNTPMVSKAPDKATVETQTQSVMEQLAQHLSAKHKDAAKKLKEERDLLYLVLSSYLVVKNYVRIPADESELLANVRTMEQALLKYFDNDVLAAQLR